MSAGPSAQTKAQLRVLLLEDSMLDAELTVGALDEFDLQHIRVDTREEFVAALQTGEFDVILADYSLPTFDGITALEIARELRPEIPFLFVSGTLGEEIAVEMIRGGATDYVLKQRISRLPVSITRALRERKEREERLKIERLLQEQDERFSLVIQSLKDHAIFLLDPEGRVLTWNDGAARIYGYAPQEIIGQPMQRLFRAEDAELSRQELEGALRWGRYAMEGWRLRKDGTQFWAEGVLSAIHRPDGSVQALVKVVRDMTERRRIEEAIRVNDKLATMGRLAATIAHEINNPLASITNLVYLIANDPNLHSHLRPYAALAERELQRVAHITRQTLGFYRDSTKPVQIDLAHTIDGVLDLYAGRMRSSEFVIERDYRSHTPIAGYPGELRQVFSNLIVNAMEAMSARESGTLRIRIRDSVNWKFMKRSGVRVTISDQGCGIPEQALKDIFEPFYSTKGEKGTGLGLWVTSGIIRKHEGTISVRSSTNPKHSGTVFSMFFPVEKAASSKIDLAAD